MACTSLYAGLEGAAETIVHVAKKSEVQEMCRQRPQEGAYPVPAVDARREAETTGAMLGDCWDAIV
jgi:hypothetical protein